MYANNNPWGSSSSSDSGLPANNPFLENSAAERFPDIGSYQQSLQPSSSHLSRSSAPSQIQQQPPYGVSQQYMGWNSQQVQSPTYGPGAFSGHGAPQLQPQSTTYAPFGQQYDQQSPYGGQPQLQAQATGFPQYQQPVISLQQYQQHQQSIVSQFDPYGGPANGQQTPNQLQSNLAPAAQSPNSQRTGPSGQQHPRQYIQSHKVELESWDASSWKHALFIFEELKRSWEMRRADIQRQLVGGHYLTAEDIVHLNGLTRNAESNIDSVVASLIQMQEVHSGYKHSLDAASKKQVREALNAGLQGLPEWP